MTLSCCEQLRRATPACPSVLLVFGGGKHAPDVILETIADLYPQSSIVGGACAGIIVAEGSSCSGSEIGMVAFIAPEFAPVVHCVDLLAHGDLEAGRRLGRLVRDRHAADAAVLLLYDSVLSFQPRRLHSAGLLLQGFQAEWPGGMTAMGGGLLTDLNLTDGWVFLDGKVKRHAALALVFPESVTADAIILRAARPISSFMTVTRIEGAEIFTLDGRRALDVVEDHLDAPLTDTAGHPHRIMTLGLKLGEQWENGTPDDYVNRLIVTADRARGSITLFEPDFYEGALVQLMQNDPAMMLDMARERVAAATTRRDGERQPFLRLYVDCAGRASAMSGTLVEEADIVAAALPDDTPFLGFYSGVEIAPLCGRSRPLDWTGVLATYSVGG
ncbi:FIST signal transduction protein [Roseomonas mucosa]|uniref:FIST signal transduction protein n=1 Tax=Roseomonas mucosa TaxID=207340 RepID=UPI0028CCEA97|nr:FIST C-terminal domain-containing protein [Roseomonas mucosa]MDT8351007.1 FIST C-terminal domain-containing protein [Roseomonas mucosa]